MQQYFDVEEGSGILTIFHTEDKVSFDMEFYGGYSINAEELLTFLQSDSITFKVTQDERVRPSFKDLSDVQVGTLEKNPDGSLTVKINTSKISSEKRPVNIELTQEQVETLEDSITVGDVERLEDGKYPVESVSKTGERKR